MGFLFLQKNNSTVTLLSTYTLLFNEPNINVEYNKTKRSKIFPIVICSIILVYAFACFIGIIAKKNNSSELILVTFSFILALVASILFILLKYKKNIFNIKNSRTFELFLLTVMYVIIFLLDRIMCYHHKGNKKEGEKRYFIEILFFDIDVITKFLWILLDINEFIFIAIGNLINFVIGCAYYDKNMKFYYCIIITMFILIFCHSLFSYYVTLKQKETFLLQRTQFDLEKYADVLNLGYFSINFTSTIVNGTTQQAYQPSIGKASKFFDSANMKTIYPEKSKLLSILGELEEINSEISSFNNSQKDNLLDSECNSSPNGVKETNNYNITNSNLFKVNEQSAIMKQNVSGSDFPLVFQKKPSILNVKSINMKNSSNDLYMKKKTMLFKSKGTINLKRAENIDQKDDINLIISSDNSSESSNNDFMKVISMISKYSRKNIEKTQDFVYLGKKRIHLQTEKEDINTNKISDLYYKIMFRYNCSMNCFQFILIDESQYQYDMIFKKFAQQISMYLHDFKNPLISLNEKVIELKEFFNDLHLHSKSDKAVFEFGKEFINEFSFLSITTTDCISMIKSYETFSKKIVDSNSKIKLDIAPFYLSEILTYLKEWMNLKIEQSGKEVIFSVNFDNSCPSNLVFCSDKLKLKQILVNIISNSFKFTDQGFISLIISRESIDDVPYVKFLIQDTGIGMDEATQKRLFEPYYSHNKGKHNKEGCGLGLLISQMMSASLGKPIEVSSIEGQGTKMWFYCEEQNLPHGAKMPSTVIINEFTLKKDEIASFPAKNNSMSYDQANKFTSNNILRPRTDTMRKKGDGILDIIKTKTMRSINQSKIDSINNTLKASDTLVCNEVIAINPNEKKEMKYKRDLSNPILQRRSDSMIPRTKRFSGYKSSLLLNTLSGVNNIQTMKKNIVTSFSELYAQLEISICLYGETAQSSNCSPIMLTNTQTIYSYPKFKFRDNKSTSTAANTNGNSDYSNIVTLNSRRTQRGFSVLIIDDDKLCQSSANRLISEFNIPNMFVDFVSDGTDFLIRFFNNELASFNLIIMDNHMRYLDGLEVVNLLTLMLQNNIGTNCHFDFNVLKKIWLCSADTDDIHNRLIIKDCVGVLCKPATKGEMEKVLKRIGAFNKK